MSVTPTHYEILGVPRDATDTEIRRGYRKAARAAHPDSGGSPAQFHAVAEAYRVLSHVELRRNYDLRLTTPSTNGTRPSSTTGAYTGGTYTGGAYRNGTRPSQATRDATRTAAGAASPDDSALAGLPQFDPPFQRDSPFLLSPADASQQIYGDIPAPRGLNALRRSAGQANDAVRATLTWLNGTLLTKYKAARVINNVALGEGRDTSRAHHLIFGGDHLAVIESLHAPFESYSWDGAALRHGNTEVSLEPLRMKVLEATLAFPGFRVAGWAVLHDRDGNPFTPVIANLSTGPAWKYDDVSPANPGSLLRGLKSFFASSSTPLKVDLAALRHARELVDD